MIKFLIPILLATSITPHVGHDPKIKSQAYEVVAATPQPPENLMNEAVAYFNAHKSDFRNQKYITIIDFSMPSSAARMFIVDMETGATKALHVAHGAGSDPGRTGYATKFSDREGTHMTSLGFYRVSEVYVGKHGRSIRMDGLSSTNKSARSRAVVVHSASYVSDANVRQGMSWGCFAVSTSSIGGVISALSGGSLIYAGLSK